jgi:DNA-binding transcriptional MerR regulator
MTALSHPESTLPSIPNKRYFTIGEVGSLCDVKSHVLRYWEQEFTQLKPTKRRGNRRYYQRHDIELIRLIRSLLYEQGFTIAGARQQLAHVPKQPSGKTVLDQERDLLSGIAPVVETADDSLDLTESDQIPPAKDEHADELPHLSPLNPDSGVSPLTQIRQALEQISRNIEPLL